MSLRLKIPAIGEPVLRQVARELAMEEIKSSETQKLIELMRETMHDALGVGLAAPQIGLPLQLAVIEVRPELLNGVPEETRAERELQPVPFHVIINPKIRLLSEPDVLLFEGCLSLPGFTAVVPRARSVQVDCINHDGMPARIEAHGYYARILQHEIDHLNGKIYIDHMCSSSFTSTENYQKHWQGKSIKSILEEAVQCTSCRTL